MCNPTDCYRYIVCQPSELLADLHAALCLVAHCFTQWVDSRAATCDRVAHRGLYFTVRSTHWRPARNRYRSAICRAASPRLARSRRSR